MKAICNFKVLCLGFALVFLTTSASADVVGYFKFDNFPTNGNANFTDDAGKGLSGLLGLPFSLPVSTPGPSGLAGDLAVAFNGKGGLVVDDPARTLNILTPPVTLECWVRATNYTGVHIGLISYGIPGGRPAERGPGGYKLGIGPTGDLLFTLFAVVDVFSAVPYPFDGEWHHVAAVYSAAEGMVHFYLDGALAASIPETRDIRPPGTAGFPWSHLDIAAQYIGLGRFEGALDRVRISKAALAVDQLDAVAATVRPAQSDTAILVNFDTATPPYPAPPVGTAIPTAEWVMTRPVHQSDGMPNRVTDTPAGPSPEPPAAGDIALQFPGIITIAGNPTVVTNMAAVADPNGVLNLTNDWTLEAWVKVDSATIDGGRDVIFYYGHPGRGYSLSINYDAGNMLQVTTLGIADMPAANTVVAADIWQHVAVVHKAGAQGSITYFLNGVESETRSYTGNTRLATTNLVLYIGAEWNGGLPFSGWIDRVRISNTSLTASQLDSDPLNPAPSPLPALRLAVARSQSNVILSWPEATSAGYILEFTDSLPGVTWSPEAATPVVAAGQKTVTIPITGSARFYRLKRP